MTKQEQMISWLTEEFDYVPPTRGQIRSGTVVRIEPQGIFISIKGLKQEGYVPQGDLERLDEETLSELQVGNEEKVRILVPEDKEGMMILSLSQVQAERDWEKALALLESGETWKGKITDFNQGGLLAKFGQLRGFVPNSQLTGSEKHNSNTETRESWLKTHIGSELSLKVITADKEQRRLIMSERLGSQQRRQQKTEQLLHDMKIGDTCRGTVRQLSNFGAFVDLDGADGMIHISELAWHKVQHPEEIVKVGQEIDVYVLELDQGKQRIALSLKRLMPDPWEIVTETYDEGQIVNGKVTNIVDFGAFVALASGLEGLVHISEMPDPSIKDPKQQVSLGDELTLRILSIDADRRRISLSLRLADEQHDEEDLSEGILPESPEDEAPPDEVISEVAISDEAVSIEQIETAEVMPEAVPA